MSNRTRQEATYQRIYAVVRETPPGRVATYGQIAAIVGNCTARMVGYAMASLPKGSDVPWQRIVNAQGKISPRGSHLSAVEQQDLLEEEGVRFGLNNKISLKTYRWSGPEIDWLLENGFDPEGSWTSEDEV